MISGGLRRSVIAPDSFGRQQSTFPVVKARGLSSGPKDLIMVDPSTFVYEFPMMVFDVFDVFSGQINIM